MKQFSKKRASIETEYRKVKSQIMEEREPCCAGCGTFSGSITFSHRIPRSRRVDLIATKENIDLMCDGCAEHVEAGRYDKLINGQEILNYIELADNEFFHIKTTLKHD